MVDLDPYFFLGKHKLSMGAFRVCSNTLVTLLVRGSFFRLFNRNKNLSVL